jgi:hypothetical protein
MDAKKYHRCARYMKQITPFKFNGYVEIVDNMKLF